MQINFDFITHINNASQQLRQTGHEKIITFERPQVYRSQVTTVQKLITLHGRPGISFDPTTLGDDQFGRELGMYPPNTRAFAQGDQLPQAFSVWEARLDALMYAEAWNEQLLTEAEYLEFMPGCQNIVALWNQTMESLGLEYRFYGTMDWGRPDILFDKASHTLRIFGKTHLGTGLRGPTPYPAIGFHQVNLGCQSPQ